MVENLDFKIKAAIDADNVNKTFKSLKQELKQLKELIASGGLDAKQLSEATNRAAQLTDHLGDFNQKIKALSSDTKKVDAVVEGFRGLAGGVAVVTGAMGFLGVRPLYYYNIINNNNNSIFSIYKQSSWCIRPTSGRLIIK